MGQKGTDRFVAMSKGKGKDIVKDIRLGCSEPQWLRQRTTNAAKYNFALANTFYITVKETFKPTSQKISFDMNKIWIKSIVHGFHSKAFLK